MPPSTIWQSTSDLLKPKRLPTPLEREAIREVHELAERFYDGACSLGEIRAATSGKQRWLATRFTSATDPAFRPLMVMLDALLAAEPNRFRTKHGDFAPDDLFDPPGKIVHEDGHQLLCFAKRWPWRIRPDEEHGIAGERNEPIYRRPEERGAELGSFGNAQPATLRPAEKEWWELESTDEVPF